MRKISFLLLVSVLILAMVFGCSSSASYDSAAAAPNSKPAEQNSSSWKGDAEYGYDNGSAPEMPAATPDPTKDSGASNTFVPDPSRKMIWNGEMELETTSFDTAVDALYDLIKECGGFIQSSAVTGEGRNASGEPRLRNGRYTVRIPSDNFQLFMQSSGNVATVIVSNTSADDITSYYFDIEARLKVLRIKEDRLIEMLKQTEKAEYKDELQYILQLENELSNVRYEIESLTGTLRKYDDLISYSTVTVYLREVREYTATPVEPETIGERISNRFASSVRGVTKAAGDFLVWFVGNSPVLVVLALIAIGVYFILRSVRARAKKKKLPSPPPDDKI